MGAGVSIHWGSNTNQGKTTSMVSGSFDPRTWLVLLKAGRSTDNACGSQEGVGRIAALMIDRRESSARVLGSVRPEVVSPTIARSGIVNVGGIFSSRRFSPAHNLNQGTIPRWAWYDSYGSACLLIAQIRAWRSGRVIGLGATSLRWAFGGCAWAALAEIRKPTGDPKRHDLQLWRY